MNVVVMALMMVGMMVFMHGRGGHSKAHGGESHAHAVEVRPAAGPGGAEAQAGSVEPSPVVASDPSAQALSGQP